MQLNEIKDIVSGVVNLYREGKGLFEKQNKPIDYHSTYTLSVDQYQQIRVHSVKGVKPDLLIAKRSPNQTEEEFNYVKENYKQVTLPVFVDTVSTIQRSFNDNNWNLEYIEDSKDDSLKAYLDEGLKETPLRMPLEAWIKGVVPSIKMRDAMGCIVVKPWFIPTTEVGGEVVISGERFEPVPYYYDCTQVVSYDENKYYLFLTKDKSPVKVGERTVNEGLVYELYDKNIIWVIRQVGQKKDYTFEYIPYFEHNLDKLPVSRLKGLYDYTEDGVPYWFSPFLFVADILDEAVLDACNLRSIKNKCVYPYRVMVGAFCDNTLEINGEIQNCNMGYFNDLTLGKRITCSSCNGSGLKNRVSPLGEMLLNPETAFGDGEAGVAGKAMYYVEPTASTTDTLRKEIDTFLNQARAILHLRTSATEVQPSQDMTATGQQLDQKALYAFIKNISDQIFELYEFCIDMIGQMRYEDYQKPTLTYPVNFDFKGESEYLAEIGDAIEKQVPQVAVQAITMKYLNSLFYNDGQQAMYFEIIKEADRLFTMSDDDIALKLTRGIVAPYEAILHDSATTFISELILEDPGFLEKEMDVKIEALIQKAKDKAGEIKPPSTNIVDSILNR